jgi:1,4-alpha-glucan branching enzyme
VVPFEGAGAAGANGGTFEAYYVRDSEVAVVGRNRRVGEQVWAAMFGYPGDADYREFHKKDAAHGFQYWRVTDHQADLAYKQTYDPYRAGQKVQDHAGHFAWLIEEQLSSYTSSHGGTQGLIAANYDTELFGHWWFEGVTWIKEVLRRLAASDRVELCTASQWLDSHPPEKAIDLPESSWGHAGTHITWINPETAWMWDALHAAERRMEGLVERYPDAPSEPLAQALAQAARELVLLQASDWEFLYTTGQARQYATERFTEHTDRFNNLAAALEGGDQGQAQSLAREYAERDNLFPDIDYRAFARRQPE